MTSLDQSRSSPVVGATAGGVVNSQRPEREAEVMASGDGNGSRRPENGQRSEGSRKSSARGGKTISPA